MYIDWEVSASPRFFVRIRFVWLGSHNDTELCEANRNEQLIVLSITLVLHMRDTAHMPADLSLSLTLINCQNWLSITVHSEALWMLFTTASEFRRHVTDVAQRGLGFRGYVTECHRHQPGITHNQKTWHGRAWCNKRPDSEDTSQMSSTILWNK